VNPVKTQFGLEAQIQQCLLHQLFQALSLNTTIMHTRTFPKTSYSQKQFVRVIKLITIMPNN